MTTSMVTGGAGFLGSHLCDRLLADGHRVICVDNLLTGRRSNVAHITTSDFVFIEHDITTPLEIAEPIDTVFHLASPASPVHYLKYPLQTLAAGADGTRNALELAKANGARFLLASTSEVYGDPEEHPQRESYWGRVNPIGPRSVYDEAKRFGEALTMAYFRHEGVDTRIARIFNTYGPRMSPHDGRAVPEFLRQALAGDPLTVFGDGSQSRSFCYVSDLITGFVDLVGSDHHMPVNLGNPTEHTILELAEVIIDLVESASTIVFEELPEDDPTVRRPDISLARRLFDFEPSVSLAEGLRSTIDSLDGTSR